MFGSARMPGELPVYCIEGVRFFRIVIRFRTGLYILKITWRGEGGATLGKKGKLNVQREKLKDVHKKRLRQKEGVL